MKLSFPYTRFGLWNTRRDKLNGHLWNDSWRFRGSTPEYYVDPVLWWNRDSACRFHHTVAELDSPTVFPTLKIEVIFFFETLISISKTARCHTINQSTGCHRNLNSTSVWRFFVLAYGHLAWYKHGRFGRITNFSTPCFWLTFHFRPHSWHIQGCW